jgi:transketolase
MTTHDKKAFLGHKALQIRIDSVRATTASKSGHPTTCLSAADVMAVLFFQFFNHDYKNPKAPNNDRFILSKGHGVPVFYATLKSLGIITDEKLMSLRKFDSVLEGHPTPRFIHNEAATGSLGQGLSIGVGMALNAKHEKLSYKTYVMMGDGEIAEGSIWEAVGLASYYKLNNLISIVDLNRLAQSGESLDDHNAQQVAKKFEAFGWHSVVIENGHDLSQIVSAFEKAVTISDKPTVLVSKTFKGYGLDDVENQNGFHGKPFKLDELDEIINTLKNRFKDAVGEPSDTFHLNTPEQPTNYTNGKDEDIRLKLSRDKNVASFEKGQALAPRKAFGYALAALGKVNKTVFALDADVQNSTFTNIFAKDFPDRFVQCFIAEQNMIGVAAGLEARGKIPFAATFACFLTRAHDQIRMAGIGRNALRLCGSHAGVSIGEDGPSQMGLEDIGMMRSIPHSIVLYPSDGVSAYKGVELMANYHKGLSYMRTTRAATPNVYDIDKEFAVGKSIVLKQSNQDMACLVGAGITLHEALKAHEMLKAQGVHVSVIDLFSVKPLDTATIRQVASKSHNRIVTIEDHYQQGGFGEAICTALVNDNISVQTLAVRDISRSGTPQELLVDAGIDANSIVSAVLSIL